MRLQQLLLPVALVFWPAAAPAGAAVPTAILLPPLRPCRASSRSGRMSAPALGCTQDGTWPRPLPRQRHVSG